MQKKYVIITYLVSGLLFLALSPVAIFYAKGYRFDLRQKEIKRTGAIEIKTEPRSAQIYLNNKLLKKTSPLKISNLTPQKYQLKITKPGFMPWESVLEVKPELVTLASHIILFPEKAKNNDLLTSENLVDFYFSWDEKLLAYNINSGEKIGFWLLDLNRKISLRLDQNNFSQILFSGDNSKILAKSGEDYYIFDLTKLNFFKRPVLESADVENFKINLSKQTKTSLNKIIWHPQDANKLFIQSQTKLFEYNLASKSLNLLLDKIKTFVEADQKLYFIREDGILASNQLVISLGYLPLGLFNSLKVISRSLPDANDYQLIVRDDRRLAYLADNDLYVFESETADFVLLSDGITGAQWSVDLLYYNQREIWIYYLKDRIAKLITRLASELDQIAWWPMSKYVIFANLNESTINFMDVSEILDNFQTFAVYKYQPPLDKISFDRKGENIWLLNKNKTNNLVLKEINILP